MADNWHNIDPDYRHIKKERKKAREFKKSQWWKNIIAQGKCHYCQKSILPSNLTMDHIVPLARGGRSTKGNIVAACKACNQSKKLDTPAEQILWQISDNDESNDNST